MTHATSLKTARPRYRAGLRGQRTFFCLFLLAAYLVVVYFLLPTQLPAFFQRLIGLVNALLAMVTTMFAVREYGRRYNRLRLPGVGSVRSGTILGVIVFLAVVVWWFSRWAPILPVN